MQTDLVQGDITAQKVDAIVNAANSSLLGGGGVDGAIHRAAGPELLAECRKIRKGQWPAGLPVGRAVITDGYNLPAKYVIHTVGPVYQRDDIDLLQDCYLNCLKLAEEHSCRSIAFPAISTGVYRVPVELSAEIVKEVLEKYSSNIIEKIQLILFSNKDLKIYKKVFLN